MEAPWDPCIPGHWWQQRFRIWIQVIGLFLLKAETLGYLKIAIPDQAIHHRHPASAVQQNLCAIILPYDMEGAVQKPETEHRPALSWKRSCHLNVLCLQRPCRTYHTLAIKLNLLIFIRSNGTPLCTMVEIDFNSKLWVIPEKREGLSASNIPRVEQKWNASTALFLCRQALKMLKEIRQLTYEEGNEAGLILTGCYDSFKTHEWKHPSNKALRKMGYDTKQDICGHGFAHWPMNCL